MSALSETPFFIVGHPRSGTTLLRFLLGSHPRLYIPEETGFIPFLVKRRQLDAELSLAQAQRVVARIGRLNHLWRDMVTDLPAFYAALPRPTLAFVLDDLYRRQIAAHGAVRWGDKTPLYVRYIPTIERIFADAQFIHVIRDGRDAALSALHKWPERRTYMDLYYLLKQWVNNVEAGRAAGQRLGDARYIEVRYEELVQQPLAALERVADFLGERFHPAMLDHTQLAREVGPGPQGHTEVQRPISTGSVGRWRSQMTPFERKMAERIAGETLAALGYERPAPGSLNAAERAALLLRGARYWLTNALRSTLYASGILTLNRGMRQGNEGTRKKGNKETG
ncbi:MAG: sulfotransferase [Anaerolineae bacterium]|nr:sulfotransferase [Anaerolineae bacterium]